MAWTLWSQDIFSKGELSPFMYARVTVNEYQNGLKTAQNVLTYPTGAAGKRFGTLYNSTLSGLTSFDQLYFQTFQYLNECVYQLVFTPSLISIYLEGLLVATVSTSLTQSQVYNASTTVIGPLFRVAGPGFKPYDLTRAANPTSGSVNGFTSSTFTNSTAIFTANRVYPVKFDTSGTIMTTVPPLTAGVTYFVGATSTTTGAIFANSQDAKDYIQNTADTSKAFVISAIGTTTATVQNTWTFPHTSFKNTPVYDFDGGYDSITFTLATVMSGLISVTASSPIFTGAMLGGAFFGGGGSGRIVIVNSSTIITIAPQIPFTSLTTPIVGSMALLAEPAWSDARGWPQVCSSYQNRALFANTSSLPNGFWASVINEYNNFGDLTSDDDDAISWYPTSDNMNFIKFIVPYRSITVHTNTGIYSSPLSEVAAITPSNFTLQLQDSTPADVLQPQAVDNQVLVLSGNDAHQMLWDGINNAYTSDVVSVINEQLIRSPVDETAYQDLRRGGSRFVFIVNANGTMAAFQTLLTQNVSGFTKQVMEQSYGDASFIQVASSQDGRCWFVVQREVATAGSPIAITGFGGADNDELNIVNTLSSTVPTAIRFTTTGSLPTTDPALSLNKFYWALAVNASAIKIYETQEDAAAGENAFVYEDSGVNSNVVPWPLSTIFTLEELTNRTYLDCAVFYAGSATDTVSTGVLFNAQDVKMVGDGFGFESAAEDNIGNQIVFKAHGVNTDVSEAYIGYPIHTIIEPMPLTISSGPSAKESTLTQPKHIRWARFMFNQTIGGTINGVPIALAPFDLANIGNPPQPATGIFEMSIMKGWNDFNNPTFTIEHDDPFNMILLGVFYSVDI